jgi:hypothetical protein
MKTQKCNDCPTNKVSIKKAIGVSFGIITTVSAFIFGSGVLYSELKENNKTLKTLVVYTKKIAKNQNENNAELYKRGLIDSYNMVKLEDDSCLYLADNTIYKKKPQKRYAVKEETAFDESNFQEVE